MTIILFALAAATVWAAGSRLPRHASAIAERFGIGHAFAGFLILGGVTSLPELATTVSATAIGAPNLALNNILGSVTFNLVLLALADAVLGRRPLTSVVAQPATMMQGVLGILLLALVVGIIAVGEMPLGPVGIGSGVLVIACAASIRIAYRYEQRPSWVAIAMFSDDRDNTEELATPGHGQLRHTLWLAFLILAAGSLLAVTADNIAERTAISGGLVGMVLLAVSTSLPELSAITGAMAMRRYELAIGEVFGSNLFNLTIIFIIDAVSIRGPVLAGAGQFESTGALLGLGLTGLFIIGLLERRDRTFLRMGYDSIGAILLYAAGLLLLAGLA